MKILLVYGYSQKNAGDLAITLGALDILLSKNHEVTILSRYNKSSKEFENSSRTYFEIYGNKIKILECPFTLNRDAGTITTLKNYLEGSMYLAGFKYSGDVDSAIKESDLIIFNGGNLLRCSSYTDYVRLKALFYPLKRAKELGKEYIIFPQSTAEINKVGEASIVEAISEAKAVYIRENLSYQKLLKNYQFDNLKRSLDCAFFIDHNNRWQIRNGAQKKSIGFTLRAQTVGDLKELDDNDQAKIISSMIQIIESYKEKYLFKLIIQSKKDIEITHSLYAKVQKIKGAEIEIIEEYEPTVLLEHFAELDLLVGMRLHSIILALSCGTPCYGVFYSQWGLKNEGLMKEFNLPFTILDSEENNRINQKNINDLLANGEEVSGEIMEIVEDGKEKLKELI